MTTFWCVLFFVEDDCQFAQGEGRQLELHGLLEVLLLDRVGERGEQTNR